jgi:hypothetical protein
MLSTLQFVPIVTPFYAGKQPATCFALWHGILRQGSFSATRHLTDIMHQMASSSIVIGGKQFGIEAFCHLFYTYF